MTTATRTTRLRSAPLAHLPGKADTRPVSAATVRIPDAPPYRRWGTVYMPDTAHPMQGLLARSLIRCGRCQDMITPGQIFTRHSVPGRGALGPQPLCWHCFPFMVP